MNILGTSIVFGCPSSFSRWSEWIFSWNLCKSFLRGCWQYPGWGVMWPGRPITRSSPLPIWLPGRTEFLEIYIYFGKVRPSQGPKKVVALGRPITQSSPLPNGSRGEQNFLEGQHLERSDLRYGSWVERSGVKFLCNLGLAFLSLERWDLVRILENVVGAHGGTHNPILPASNMAFWVEGS